MTALRTKSAIIALVIMFSAFQVVTSGQKKQLQVSDLAGDWELEIQRSERRYRSGSLSVKVNGDEVVIIRELEDANGVSERKLTYFADGRGELNFWIAADGRTEIDRQSRSRWKKNKLVVSWPQRSKRGSYEIEEIYELAADGAKLTNSINSLFPRIPFRSPFGSIDKMSFRK